MLLAECAGLTDIYVGGGRDRPNGGFAAWANPAIPDHSRRMHGSGPRRSIPGPQAINGTNSLPITSSITNQIYSFHNQGANVAMADGSVRFLQPVDQAGNPDRTFDAFIRRGHPGRVVLRRSKGEPGASATGALIEAMLRSLTLPARRLATGIVQATPAPPSPRPWPRPAAVPWTRRSSGSGRSARPRACRSLQPSFCRSDTSPASRWKTL